MSFSRFSRNISKSDSLALKGVGISMIMFHNYFHLLPGSLTENEFVFDSTNAINFLHRFSTLSIGKPEDWSAGIAGFFSFLGHYGVAVFVFLSAYGLSRKYGEYRPGIKDIVYPKLLKFWKLLVPVLVVLVLLQLAGIGGSGEAGRLPVTLLKDSFLHLLFVHTLYPGKALSIVGAWWFFGVIVQLYLLFPWLNRLRPSRLLWVMAGSWLIQAWCVHFFPDVLFYFRTNFPGWLPEFCLGIYLAKDGKTGKTVYWVVAALLVFAGSFLNPYVWLMSGTAAIFLALGVQYGLNRRIGRLVRPLFVLLGEYSFYLFVIHGFIRDYVLYSGMPDRLGPLFSAGIFFVLSVWVAVGIGWAGSMIKRRTVFGRI